MIKIILLTLLISLGFASDTKIVKNEKYYQNIWCDANGGETEYILQDKSRVDCLTDEYAVEVDWGKKWAECVGQSLYYGLMTNKKPACLLILSGEKDAIYLDRLNATSKKHDIKVFIINAN